MASELWWLVILFYFICFRRWWLVVASGGYGRGFTGLRDEKKDEM